MLRGILADRFEIEKIPADLDTIVIGSGMSGLSCAAVLSRMGQRVLVLEQHYVAGGGSHDPELIRVADRVVWLRDGRQVEEDS